jgi:hypothetical protein
MSTTTSGPVTPVVRRMMPSGCRYRAESDGGVFHPSTHVLVAGPRVGNGVAGGLGGCTGEELGEAVRVSTGDSANEGEARRSEFPLSQADSTSAATASRRTSDLGPTNPGSSEVRGRERA